MGDLSSPVVIDNGSFMMKVGLAASASIDAPSKQMLAFPSVTGEHHGASFVGYDAVKRSRSGVFLALEHPLRQGVVRNWDSMEQVWKYSFKKISCEPEDHPVILTEVPFNPNANREKMIQIMFETFNTPSVYVANQAALALLGCGRTTGVVYDSGDSVSHSVPIYEGHALNHATFRVNLAGHDLTESLGQMLSKQGLQFSNQSSFNDTVRELKEKLCYVAQDYETETQAINDKTEKMFRLPDGQEFTLDQECIQCPEALFMPTLIQSDTGSQLGIHDSCYKSVMSCDIDLREELFGNVVLSGGNTMFSGIADRMHKEMTDLAPSDSKINVIAPPERNYLTWTGGSVLGSLSTFKQMWISRQEYEETGVYIVHSKCF